MACGEIGLDIQYFYQLTPREFNNIVKGFAKKREDALHLSWEQTRSIMFTVAAPNLPKSKKHLKITDFMPFPWEKSTTEKTKPNKEDLKEVFKKWDNLNFKK